MLLPFAIDKPEPARYKQFHIMQYILDYEMSDPSSYRFSTRVSFGDCDPAGIVFYPNILAWMDRAFHDWLWEFGGHETLCARLDAIGIGLFDVSARFTRPLRNGDRITVLLTVEAWEKRSVKLLYEIHSDGELMASGQETRGLFALGETGMIAAKIDSLRRLLEHHEE